MYNQVGYDNATINSSNLLVRWSHRNRIKTNYNIVSSRLSEGRWLDYGCGTGVLLNEIIQSLNMRGACGYEPFFEKHCTENLPIFQDYEEIVKLAPFATITVFEVFEHLQWKEISTALSRFANILKDDGKIYISVPIEIGPALIPKVIHRKLIGSEPSYRFFEFIGAAFLGISGYRENPEVDYMCHKGFNFRHLIRFIKSRGWKVKIIKYGPLPIPTWYGNSQVFLSVFK